MRTIQDFQQAIPGPGKEYATTSQGNSVQIIGWVFLLVIAAVTAASYPLGFQTAITILTVFGFAAAIVGIVWPVVGLLGIGLLCTLDAVTRNFLLTGGVLRWNTLNYWLLIVMVLNLGFLIRINDIHSRILQLFVFVISVELIYSSNLAGGIQDVLNVVTTFGILIYFIRSVKDNEKSFYWLGIVNGVLGALITMVYYQQSARLPYINPNSLAFFPVTALFSICLGFSFARNGRQKFVLFALAVINFVWIFLSGSRGNLLTGFWCLLFLIIKSRSFSWTVLLVGMVVIGALFVSSQYLEEQTHTLERVQRLFNPNLSLASRTSQRSDLASGGIQLFLENPLGVGTGSFESEFANIDIYSRIKPAHSAWVKVLAENGVLGIFLMVAFLLSFVVVGWKKRKEDLFLIGLLVGLSFAVVFISKEFQGKGLWFLAAGGIFLLHREEMTQTFEGKIFQRFQQKYIFRTDRHWYR
ncbi:MAG TPA: O-antigen ligase family protein [Anaerolineaceae bacterium]|nr:O-antigen ligase family protein [Anaerolineaceae bacterium]